MISIIISCVFLRAPDYCNIPEKVEESPSMLRRSDSVKDIPKEVTEDAHAEPKRLQVTT